jgi:hypothetical protein
MITAAEGSTKLTQLRKNLVALSREEIGMGNYKKIMRDYQELLNALIINQRDLWDLVATLSQPESEKKEE